MSRDPMICNDYIHHLQCVIFAIRSGRLCRKSPVVLCSSFEAAVMSRIANIAIL